MIYTFVKNLHIIEFFFKVFIPSLFVTTLTSWWKFPAQGIAVWILFTKGCKKFAHKTLRCAWPFAQRCAYAGVHFEGHSKTWFKEACWGSRHVWQADMFGK